MASDVSSSIVDLTEGAKLMNIAEITRNFEKQLQVTNRRKRINSESTIKTDGSGVHSVHSVPRKVASFSGASNVSLEKYPLLRRRSTYRGISQGITSITRMRRMTRDHILGQEQPPTKYQNTFQLGPTNGEHFNVSEINEIAYTAMEQQVGAIKYDFNTAGSVACNLSVYIKDRVKELNIPRYRIICQVLILPNSGQGLESASSFLWDEKKDNYTCIKYKNQSLIAVAIVHGVYFE